MICVPVPRLESGLIDENLSSAILFEWDLYMYRTDCKIQPYAIFTHADPMLTVETRPSVQSANSKPEGNPSYSGQSEYSALVLRVF